MKSIYIILNNVFAISGVAFRVVDYCPDYKWWRCHGKFAKATFIAFITQKGENFLFCADNIEDFNKESNMSCVSILEKYRGRRAYSRIAQLSYLASKDRKYRPVHYLNGDDWLIRREFYSIRL